MRQPTAAALCNRSFNVCMVVACTAPFVMMPLEGNIKVNIFCFKKNVFTEISQNQNVRNRLWDSV